MKRVILFAALLIAIMGLIVPIANAQSFFQAPPLGLSAAEQRTFNSSGINAGVTWTNSQTSYSAQVNVENMDSLQVGIFVTDTASISAVYAISFPFYGCTAGDTSTTLGSFTATNPTDGKYGLLSTIYHPTGKWLQVKVVFAGSANSTGVLSLTNKYRQYIAVKHWLKLPN
jgi:hypothetical protein